MNLVSSNGNYSFTQKKLFIVKYINHDVDKLKFSLFTYLRTKGEIKIAILKKFNNILFFKMYFVLNTMELAI